MTSTKLVVCAKDRGAFKVVAPIALMAKRDCEVHVVTEGLAAFEFQKNGFDPDFVGTVDFTQEPFPFDARDYLNLQGRCVVIIGESSPANLESKLGKAAGELNYPVVECQDFWRGHNRLSSVMPNVVLTIDDYARDLVLKDLSVSEENVIVVGNPGAQKVTVSHEVFTEFNALRAEYDSVLYYSGGGGYTAEELHLLLACMDKTPGSRVLVVGFHPRRVHQFGDQWREILRNNKERVVEAQLGTGEEWASLTTTISGFGTPLATAIFHGQVAISLKTPATMASLKRQNDLDEIPYVALGCAHSVTEPINLLQFEYLGSGAEKIKPYDPDLAWTQVKKIEI